MSKRSYISRYSLIIKKLKAKPYSSYEDLLGYIENQLGYLQMQDESLNMGFSKRTLQRDIKEIRNLFGVDINYSTKNKGYYIDEGGVVNNNFQRMIEAFDLFTSLNITQDISPFVQLENRPPQGTENLYGLLHAIKNKLQIQFNYQKFWEENPTQRKVEPYTLKEFKNRWYILAKDCKDKHFKTFALDRLSNLEISNNRFTSDPNYKTDDIFQYCYGIISPIDEKPRDIILSFQPYQGKYIKTLPLHYSQQIIIDNEKELQIKLKLFITHDFEMELLSFGDNVKV